MSELQVSLVFSVIIWVNVIRENYLTFFPSRCRRYPSFFFADASILVRGKGLFTNYVYKRSGVGGQKN